MVVRSHVMNKSVTLYTVNVHAIAEYDPSLIMQAMNRKARTNVLTQIKKQDSTATRRNYG